MDYELDYDLIVVGVSDIAYRLVTEASRLGARVGWRIPNHDRHDQSFNMPSALDLAKALSIINISLHSKLGSPDCPPLLPVNIPMNIKGVDVREIFSDPQNSYSITERAYVYAIAAPDTPAPRPILGLAEHPYLTAIDIYHWADQWQRQDPAINLPSSIAILGNDCFACTIAQITNLLQINTLLLVNHDHILPHVDVAVARTLQGQLELAGIAVHTQTQVTAVELVEGRSRLWVNRLPTIDCDRLLIPVPPQHYAMPYARSPRSILPCQSDRDIAKIINQIPNLDRAILSSKAPIVRVTPTQPPIAQVGQNEAMIQQNYAKSQFNIQETVTTDGDLCQINCDNQGRILGASMCGDQAESVIRALAIAMQGQVKLAEIDLPSLQLTIR